MEKKITIKYQWWKADNGKTSINKDHISKLEEDANERMKHMQAEGFKSFELRSEIDEIQYYGWCEITEETTFD